jgi:sugar fermentation stimulation protein A
MKYPNIIHGIFLSRPNRFIAHVMVNGREEIAHVKNTGRCRELLIPGATVFLQRHDNPSRKTRFSLIAVEKGSMLVNIDSQAPNKVLLEALTAGLQLPGLEQQTDLIKPESVYGDSRFDFYVQAGHQKAYIEVKGVTLEHDGIASFPDAPTERGVKHIRELIKATENGYMAYVVFILQMKGMRWVRPNDETHAAFGDALRDAKKAGVHIIAYDCYIAPDEMRFDEPVPVVV